MKTKGGCIGTKLRPHLSKLSQVCFLSATHLLTISHILTRTQNTHTCTHNTLPANPDICFNGLFAPIFHLFLLLPEMYGTYYNVLMQQCIVFEKLLSIDSTLICPQNLSTEARREAVICALILYLGEKEEDLFEDWWVKRDFFFWTGTSTFSEANWCADMSFISDAKGLVPSIGNGNCRGRFLSKSTLDHLNRKTTTTEEKRIHIYAIWRQQT